jgi:hypothetical protein
MPACQHKNKPSMPILIQERKHRGLHPQTTAYLLPRHRQRIACGAGLLAWRGAFLRLVVDRQGCRLLEVVRDNGVAEDDRPGAKGRLLVVFLRANGVALRGALVSVSMATQAPIRGQQIRFVAMDVHASQNLGVCTENQDASFPPRPRSKIS